MKFLLSAFLASVLFLPLTAKAESLTPQQQEEVKKLVQEYLLNNGEEIVQGVEKYQKKLADEAQKDAEKAAQFFIKNMGDTSNLPTAGNQKGDITMIEFFDYNCGFCKRALEEIVTVLEKDKNIHVIFFDMPILGPNSKIISQWSLAAHKQGKYFEFHQAAMHASGQKDEKLLEQISKDIGLDIEQMKKDKDSKEIIEQLDKNVEQAQNMNIRGTPGFIINGKVFPGYMPAEKILEILAEERKNKKQ